MKKALGQYATSGSSEMPVKEIDKLVQTLDNTIAETDCFCRNIGVDFRRVLNTGTVFRKLDAFAEFQNLILANDDHKERFFLLTSLMENLHDAAKPDIFQMAWSNELFSPILYLRDLMRGTVRDDRIEKAKSRINDLLDHPARFRQLAEGTVQCAKHYTWDEREKFLNNLYDELLKK